LNECLLLFLKGIYFVLKFNLLSPQLNLLLRYFFLFCVVAHVVLLDILSQGISLDVPFLRHGHNLVGTTQAIIVVKQLGNCSLAFKLSRKHNFTTPMLSNFKSATLEPNYEKFLVVSENISVNSANGGDNVVAL